MSITVDDVMSMVNHWLQTPQDSYLGTDYGNNLKEILQSPHTSGLANEQIKKMINDIPILSLLPTGSINFYKIDAPPDKSYLVIDIQGMQFTFTGA